MRGFSRIYMFYHITFNNIFLILIIHKPSLWSPDVPQKMWARSVQSFWRLLDTNKQTDRQTDKPNLYIEVCYSTGCIRYCIPPVLYEVFLSSHRTNQSERIRFLPEIRSVLVIYNLTTFYYTDLFILYFFIQNAYADKKVLKKG